MQVSIGSSPSELPAWIQAVGSVAAILIAIYVPFRQRQAEEKRRINSQKHLAKFITSQIDYCIDNQKRELDNFVGQFKESFNQDSAIQAQEWINYADESMDLAKLQIIELERFKSLPISDWPSFDAAATYFSLCAENRDTMNMIDSNWNLDRNKSLVEALLGNIADHYESMNIASQDVKDAFLKDNL